MVGIAVAALAALLAASPAAAAEREPDRVLAAYVDAEATNRYFFFLNAFRGQPGGATVTAAFSDTRSTVIYIRRKPALVTKHRIKADLGELGEVDLRIRKESRPRRGSDRCGPQAVTRARFTGGLHLSSDFSDVRTARLSGFAVRASIRRACAADYGPLIYRDHDVTVVEPVESSLLTSCGDDAGTGFAAIKESDKGEGYFDPFGDPPAEFFASKTTRSEGLEIIRTSQASGSDRRFGIQGKSARVAPPEPFAGRAHFRGGRLTGNLRVALPGAGEVRLTPGEGDLGKSSSVAIPKCFPSYFTSSAGRPAVDQAVAEAVRRATLTPSAQRVFAALDSRGR